MRSFRFLTLIKTAVALYYINDSLILACDLSATGIFKVAGNGKFTFGDEYKMKLSNKNPATGETLQNKGKLAKARASLGHKNLGWSYSGKLLDTVEYDGTEFSCSPF